MIITIIFNFVIKNKNGQIFVYVHIYIYAERLYIMTVFEI